MPNEYSLWKNQIVGETTSGESRRIKVDDNGELIISSDSFDSSTPLQVEVVNNNDINVNAKQSTHDNLNANVNLQVNNTDVSASNEVPTNDSDLNTINSDMIGGNGSLYVDDTNAATPLTGKYFYCIVPNEETVVNTMTVTGGWAALNSKTIAQGIPVYTKCSSITLTSGSIHLYQRSV